VALVLTSAAGEFWWMVFIATVYSQVIGLSCALTSLLTIRWLDAQAPWRGQAGIMAQYFACGVGGAEIARRVCAWVIGPGFNAGPPFVSWARPLVRQERVFALRATLRLGGRAVSWHAGGTARAR